MRSLLIYILFFSIGICKGHFIFAQDKNDKVKRQDYQIYLAHPAKAIKLLMYEKDFVPIQGKLSEDKKSIILKDYILGSKVHVKVEYEDGTVEEFVKSPCYIDPVISMDDFVSPLKTI